MQLEVIITPGATSWGAALSFTIAAARLCLLGVMAMGLASCGTAKKPAAPRDPADPIRFHTWEDYYERGRRRVLAGSIQAAKEDFETCLGIRRGARRSNSQDAWRVRTHGMHMFDGYFPNRELGVCHYHQGNLAMALDFLRRSMSQTPTDRAEFFINQVTADILKQALAEPPRILLDTNRPVLTRGSEYVVKGLAIGNGRISRISIDGAQIHVGAAQEELPFAQTVPLDAGENTIEIIAEDLKGQSVREELTVFADRLPPHVAVVDVVQLGERRRVRIECGDDVGLSGVRVDDKPLPFDTESGQTAFTLMIDSGEPTPLTVADRAGNTLTVDLTHMTDGQTGLTSPGTSATGGAADEPLSTNGLPGPVIRVQHDRDVYVVHRDRFFVDGEVTFTGRPSLFTLNGRDVLGKTGADDNRVRFAAYHGLKEGTNVLTLVAEDAEGHRQTRNLTVVRRPPEYVKKSYRLGASVPPLYASRRPSDGTAWQTRVVEKMIGAARPRFNLMSVDAEDMEAVLAEMNLQRMSLVDPRARIDYSRLNSADLSFNGLLVHHREGIELRFHLVDADTGARHGYVDVYIDESDPDPDIKLNGLITKIERHYPVLSGRVLDSAGDDIRLDAGEQAGLNDWARFLVVRPGPDGSIDRGTILCNEGRHIELQIVDLEKNESVATPLGSLAAGLVSKGDYFYAR